MVEELHTWAAINKQQFVLKERLYQNLKGLGCLPSVQEVLDSFQYICPFGLCTRISSIVLNFLVKTEGLLFDYWIVAFVDLNLLSITPPQKIFKKFGPAFAMDFFLWCHKSSQKKGDFSFFFLICLRFCGLSFKG
jgi:hypothetical protein